MKPSIALVIPGLVHSAVAGIIHRREITPGTVDDTTSPATPLALAARAATTCGPPLQTSWAYVKPPGNAGKDHGPPKVPQGKAANGQPKPGGEFGKKRPRNLILIIPDGFGPTSEVFARDFVQWNNSATGWNYQLAADSLLIGTIRTRATDSYVTDSAASATAYSCAIKSYNGAIGVDDDGNPCGTVLEAAKAAGYKTGLVVTSRITHATPASFASHSWDRDAEDKIALQMVGGTPLGRVADVMLGGGLRFFLPNTTAGSARKDDIDVLQRAKNNGYSVFTDRAGFDALQGGNADTAKNPYFGLFASSHMSYEVDRVDSKEPSLLEMTKTAIKSLERMSKGEKKGYFLMVEASRIDHAGHSNDLIGHLHDIIHFNEVVAYIKSYVDSNGETTFIGTADHETGGLALGGIVETGEYQYNPEPLSHGYHSTEYLASYWSKYAGPDLEGTLTDVFRQYGINDANSTEIEVGMSLKGNNIPFEWHLGQSLSRRSLVKWTTGGHTGVDVNLIGAGRNIERMVGNHDNTEVGQFIADQLDLDLPAVTKKLNSPKNETWLVDEVGRDKIENGVKTGARLARRGHHHH